MVIRSKRRTVIDALRRDRRPAAIATAAALLGLSGCASLSPSHVGGAARTASRTLSPEQLREVAATFEAQGRAERAEVLFAAADRREGFVPSAPGTTPPAVEQPIEPPPQTPPAPVMLAEGTADAPAIETAVDEPAGVPPLESAPPWEHGEPLPPVLVAETPVDVVEEPVDAAPEAAASDSAASAWSDPIAVVTAEPDIETGAEPPIGDAAPSLGADLTPFAAEKPTILGETTSIPSDSPVSDPMPSEPAQFGSTKPIGGTLPASVAQTPAPEPPADRTPIAIPTLELITPETARTAAQDAATLPTLVPYAYAPAYETPLIAVPTDAPAAAPALDAPAESASPDAEDAAEPAIPVLFADVADEPAPAAATVLFPAPAPVDLSAVGRAPVDGPSVAFDAAPRFAEPTPIDRLPEIEAEIPALIPIEPAAAPMAARASLDLEPSSQGPAPGDVIPVLFETPALAPRAPAARVALDPLGAPAAPAPSPHAGIGKPTPSASSIPTLSASEEPDRGEPAASGRASLNAPLPNEAAGRSQLDPRPGRRLFAPPIAPRRRFESAPRRPSDGVSTLDSPAGPPAVPTLSAEPPSESGVSKL
ncbi:MAG: hypothetical protein AAF907_04135 [Planctomycetota bacterium]